METVTKCEKIKDWNGKPIYAIEMSNGATGESFAVEIPIGTPEDQLTFTPNGNYPMKVKWNKPNTGGGFKGGNRGGNESFALSYAKDLAVANVAIGNPPTIEQILVDAEKLYKWLQSKKQ